VRVLIVADVVGGVRTFTAELTRVLAGRGDEVHLALIGPAARAHAVGQVGAASCEAADLRLEWMENPWGDVAAAAAWVAELTDRHRPDVVHMNTFTPVLDPAAPVLLSVHSCVLSWWRAVHGGKAPSRWDRYRALVTAALARAEAVVVPSRTLLDELRRLYRWSAETCVIPNGRRVASTPVVREPLTVTVGRLWDPAKNVELVAAAAASIDGRVVAVGSGEVNGLETTGELEEDELVGWLSRAAVFAAPARYEPFGLSALEAAQCGCSLVLGDIPSLREVWGEAAVYVPTDDPPALAAAVNCLLRDSGHRALAVRAAADRARRYTPEAMAGAYGDVYAEVARAAAGSPPRAGPGSPLVRVPA
jgi:glycogen synthase